MRVHLYILIIAAAFVCCVYSEKQDYTGYRLIRIQPKTLDQSDIIDKLEEHFDVIKKWFNYSISLIFFSKFNLINIV
jgi:hypothetical protein